MADYTYKRFNPNEDIVAGKRRKKVFPIWTDDPIDLDVNDDAVLQSFWTQSSEVNAWEGNYYYNVFGENTLFNANPPVQFSIAFGTTQSIQLQHSDDEYKYTYPSRAIYGQYASTLSSTIVSGSKQLERAISGSNDSPYMPIIYVINIARARLKDSVEIGTLQLNLSASNAGHSGVLNLITSPFGSDGDTSIPIVTGKLSDYVLNQYGTYPTSSHPDGIPVGTLYPKRGIFVLDAIKIQSLIGTSANFNPSAYTSSIPTSYEPSGALGSIWEMIKQGKYFRARTTEMVQTTHYFCRAKNYEFNYSTNPTWVSGSNNEVLDEFYAEPRTFITTVGLYDGQGDSGQLVAVAKLSRPIPKSTDTEALIKVMLSF